MHKMFLDNNAKRACIYFIYDRDGIIDNYVIYQLNDMRKNVDYLYCVINGKVTSEGKESLSKIADAVCVRENKGVDVGAYKAAINNIGWKKLEHYDELVLMNNTCFGPVYPFKEIFDWAMTRDVDFWGLTYDCKSNWLRNNKYLHYNNNKIHIQSYFLTIRKTLLCSKLFFDFINNMPDNIGYIQSGSFYEYAFPGYFEERGYKGAVYCGDADDNNYPLLYNPQQLLKDFRMPLFKKRSFFHHYTNVLSNSAGEATARLVRFLENETDYDMNLVWDSILRTHSLADIVRSAQLNRVLPRDLLVNNTYSSRLRVGLVYHVFYEDLFEEDMSYISNFSDIAGVLVTTDTSRKRDKLKLLMKKNGIDGLVTVIGNRGRDVSSLLVGAADFVFKCDLVCFAHDKKTTQVTPHSIGRSWAYKLNENVFATKEYVANIVNMFERETRLGIAFPSPPNHSSYADYLGDCWTGNFENTKKLLNGFNVHVAINKHALCVAPLGTCFWFRPLALKKLFAGLGGKGWSYEDFPREPNRNDQTVLHAIERSYAYFAQDAGYYPVYIYNDKYAEIEFTNLEFNKSGAAEMREWVDKLAMDAIGYKLTGDISNKSADEISSAEKVYHPERNYGVRQSLVNLAFALGCKYPRMWRLFMPIRRITQKILRIRTR